MATNVQAVLNALDVFGRAPDKASLDTANAWLQDFQHSVNTFRTDSPPPPDHPLPARFRQRHGLPATFCYSLRTPRRQLSCLLPRRSV